MPNIPVILWILQFACRVSLLFAQFFILIIEFYMSITGLSISFAECYLIHRVLHLFHSVHCLIHSHFQLIYRVLHGSLRIFLLVFQVLSYSLSSPSLSLGLLSYSCSFSSYTLSFPIIRHALSLILLYQSNSSAFCWVLQLIQRILNVIRGLFQLVFWVLSYSLSSPSL